MTSKDNSKCIFPNCNKNAKMGCVCHLGDGWWCKEHLDNHYEATRQYKRDD